MKHYATILELEAAESLATYDQDFYQGTPAVTKHAYGKGESYFIGARLEDSFQDDFYHRLLQQLQITPIISMEGNPEVSVQGRQIDDDKAIIFIMNFSEKEQQIKLNEQVTDRESGNMLTGDLTLAPYEVRIVETKLNNE